MPKIILEIYMKYNKGEMGLGMMLLMVIVGLFIIWVLTGGQSKSDNTKPYVKPYTDQQDPGGLYGPEEK